jgi:hypothetical protein
MAGSGPPRKRIDLRILPKWAQVLIAVATVAVVVGIALLVGDSDSGAVVPISAIVGGVIAFGLVAWQQQHRR